jgi:hypothetical protein
MGPRKPCRNDRSQLESRVSQYNEVSLSTINQTWFRLAATDLIMRFLTIVAAIVSMFFALHSSAELVFTSSDNSSSEWTYQEIHDYAVRRSGGTDFTASVVKNHIASSGRNWTDVYQGDIHLDGDGNGVLTTHARRGAHLAKTKSSAGRMCAFPYSGNCEGVAWCWVDPDSQCYTYDTDGHQLSLFSVLFQNMIIEKLGFYGGTACTLPYWGYVDTEDQCYDLVDGWWSMFLSGFA